jgi:hypothetical protein
LWPPQLAERTAPYFDVQAILNRVYWEGGQPTAHADDLDRLLSTTTLRTLPLWLLGSDEVKQRIAETSDDSSGAKEYAHALRAISGRDFGGAAGWLAAAQQRGLRAPQLVPLRAYALAKAGQVDEARALAAAAGSADNERREFWQWLGALIAQETSPAHT